MVEKAKKQDFMAAWFAEYYWQVSLAAGLALLAAGYFVLVGPKISAARTVANVDLAAEREREGALADALRTLLALEEARNRIPESAITRVGEILPSDPALPDLLASLEAIAVASSVSIEGVEFAFLETESTRAGRGGGSASAASALPGGVRAIEANLRIIASPYSNVKQFLKNTEKSLRLMDVTGLLYTPSAKNYTVILQSYYQP
ncbi:MAG: hypothetical protein HY462_00775 [Parcubacteria group bacterium]|nr:hypothetical protein [Parcubacteria group bacterium]